MYFVIVVVGMAFIILYLLSSVQGDWNHLLIRVIVCLIMQHTHHIH